jgi:hypothetical protein
LGTLKKNPKKKKNMDNGGFSILWTNAGMLALNWTTEHILPQANF